MGYHRAGFEVVGVDIKPQPHYPFTFVQGEAVGALDVMIRVGGTWNNFHLRDFDAIHASPPCQAYSSLKVMPNSKKHPELIDTTRDLLMRIGKPWVIENVVGAPVEKDDLPLWGCHGITLCGTMFGLNNGSHELRRHRLFECSHRLPQPKCDHRHAVIGFYGDHARTRQRTVNGHRHRGGDITGLERKMPLVKSLLGIDWMTWHEAVLAIPPAYTEFIGKELIRILEPAAILGTMTTRTYLCASKHLPGKTDDGVAE